MRFIRKSEIGLETRTQSYTNRNGRTITTVGAMHAATPESWVELIDFLVLAESKGSVIHLEGVQPANDSNISDFERKSIAAMTSLISLGQSLSELTGLQYQKEAFLQAPRWEKHDLSIIDVVRGMDDKTLEFISGISVEGINISPEKAIWGLRNINRVRWIGFFVPTVRRLLASLIDDRNVFAVKQAIAENKDVVLFWGAAHLPGMHKLLRKAGFKPTKSSWRLVIPSSYVSPVESHSLDLDENKVVGASLE